MPAQFIPIGEPANDAERQAIHFLVDQLSEDYTVYGNPWLVERSGVITELDAVVVAPHGVFVVEVKSYRGRIEGTDNDWWVPYQIRSPLKLNRKTAQILKTHLRDASYEAGQVWVEGFVFLSATTDVGVRGPASNDRVHTRKTIAGALTSRPLMERLSQGRLAAPSHATERALLEIFTGAKNHAQRPVRRIREYELVETLEQHEAYAEFLGRNELASTPETPVNRVLRVYGIPPLASDGERTRLEERTRWEAQVLTRLGRIDGILRADPPFADEAGIVLPLEAFAGVTLTTWIERHGPEVRKQAADLPTRVDLWIRIAQAIDEAHRQGVVHRLLRPDVILVENKQHPKEIRITGFDLAKQLASDATIAISSLSDERLVYAAPEVVAAFSSAEPASDQFSLGAILAQLLTGKPLFESTRAMMAAGGRLLRRVRDKDSRIPLGLDGATTRMLATRPNERFSSLEEAIDAVRNPGSRMLPAVTVQRATELNPEELASGTRIGTDYEIESRLGQGGMSVVYAAKHLVSGRKRALKVARPETAAEEALHGEYRVLSALDHPNIVRVVDFTKVVEGRLTLVMERVGGQTLRQWLASQPVIDSATQRRLAEDLLAGLDYLEQKGVTHKDLKPENLVVDDGHLTIIDFNLAASPEDASYGGTAMYRDPASVRWTHATDRYAAALCLFELYAGRHAFDGRVPEPGAAPQVSDEDISPSGLAKFFQTALHPNPERRSTSARAMRDGLLRALGEDLPIGPTVDADPQIDTTTPLRMTPLSRRAQNALARCRVQTVGELLAMAPEEIRAIHAIGTKTAADILAFQDSLRQRGVAAGLRHVHLEPPLFPALCDAAEPLTILPLTDVLREALSEAGMETVGDVASATRSALLQVERIGRGRIAELVRALDTFHTRSAGVPDVPRTLDGLWELAARPLSDGQRIAVERCVGVTGEAELQGLVAESLGKSQPQVSIDLSKGIERIDRGVLSPVSSAVEHVLTGFGGIAVVDDLGERLEEQWPGGAVSGAGVVRLLVRLAAGTMHLCDVDGGRGEIVAHPMFDRETLRAFVAEVDRIAGTWPPVEPDAARRSLAGVLPHFDGDPLALGIRLRADVQATQTGHLFIPPVEASDAFRFVLDRLRDAMTLDEVVGEVRRMFGEFALVPQPDELLGVLGRLDCRVQGGHVVPGTSASVVAPVAEHDAPTITTDASRSAEEVARSMLVQASRSRGFRMLVTPPERHLEIGRSVAAATGGTWLSFDEAFFNEHGSELASLERAERFAAQRSALTEAAEQTLFALLDRYGQAGRTIVLGDTGLWGICDALDLPRRLYDETLSGGRGFWIVVVPGVIYKRQPRFNEGPAMWHLEGATVQLLQPLAVPTSTA